jgi:hypothetical protein
MGDFKQRFVCHRLLKCALVHHLIQIIAVEYISLLRHKDYSMEQELLMLKQELENLKK